jgi:hypothetical protein
VGFKPQIDANQWFLIKNPDGVRYLYPSLEQEEYTNLNIPTGNLFIGFKEALALKNRKEIQNN